MTATRLNESDHHMFLGMLPDLKSWILYLNGLFEANVFCRKHSFTYLNKIAKVIPIFKNGHRDDMYNYRPI